MKTLLHTANTRGKADHGWLKANFSFSFANYYDPKRMNFGVLRVLNDDTIGEGTGFGKHPHDNMEIITIPLSGALEHQDSLGNGSVIQSGEIQVMSAGTGIFHSEKNPNSNQKAKVLQIWVFPNKQNVEPRYDQLKLNPEKSDNKWAQILSPDPKDDGVWIHQDAWFHLGNFDAQKTDAYSVKKPETNGVYVFVIEGEIEINGQKLEKRDALGIWDTDKFEFQTFANSKILLLEVPMSL